MNSNQGVETLIDRPAIDIMVGVKRSVKSISKAIMEAESYTSFHLQK